MAKHNTPQIDAIKQLAKGFDFPSELEFNQYRDTHRQADVIQIYFRYHPFSGVS